MACPALIDRRPGRNRVTSIVTKNSSNATLHSRTYTFNLASEVTQIVEGAVTTDYTYDDAGQLETEVKSTGYSAAYSYDGNGNRLTRTVNGVTENYSYDAGDKLTAIVGGADPRTFTYDGAGRTTGIVRSSGTTSFTYDYESRVTSITKPGMTTNSMTYNGLDTRVGMTDSTGSRTFKRAGIGVTSPVLSDGSASFTPSGENRAGVKTAYHGGLKSFDTQTNSAQAVVGQRLTDAFGNQISSSGVWKGRFAYGGPYGYQEDPDTGLRLLGHRYYDSSTGRFLTRDPIKDGQNWYAYCDNNPVTYVDANGLVPRPISTSELQQLALAIALLIITGKYAEAAQLWALAKSGQIWVEDDTRYLDENSPGFTSNGFSSNGMKSGTTYIVLAAYLFGSDQLYDLAATILHELVHVMQIANGRFDTSQRRSLEDEAYRVEVDWLSRLTFGGKARSEVLEKSRRFWKEHGTIGGGSYTLGLEQANFTEVSY